MKQAVFAIAAMGLALGLGSCTTMTAEQCMAGDWANQGFEDGQKGLAMSQLNEHAKACSEHGVEPDASAYAAGRDDGLLRYCTVEGGFEAGRSGSSYRGVCPADLERDFVPAYEDGRMLYGAESALSSAESALDSARNRAADRDEKLTAKQRELRQEGLTDQQREQIRNRIREVRDELEDAEDDMRRAERDYREAERELDFVRRRLGGVYRPW